MPQVNTNVTAFISKGEGSAEVRLESSSGNGYLRLSGTRLNLHNNGEERLTIQNDGLVGIGTTSPVSSLHIGANYNHGFFSLLITHR